MTVIRTLYGTSTKVNWIEVFLIVIVFILLPPIIGLTLVIGYLLSRKSVFETYYYAFFICVAIYFACINATKQPDGDQIQYYYAYKNVPKLGFFKSLIYIYGIDFFTDSGKASISGEFMNGVYNYFGYYLTFGYYPLFAALLTFFDYILIFFGLYKFNRTLKRPHVPIVAGVIILSFFYLYFNYTLQIQKQFLAQSIMMYVLGSYAVTGRMKTKEWTMMICAIFTHAATILFVPFLVFKPLRRRLTKKGLLLLCVFFSLFIIVGPRLAGNVSSTVGSGSTMTYGVDRLANSEVNNQDDLGLVWSQVFLIAVPMLIIVLWKLWLERKVLFKSHAFILNIVLLLLLTVAAMFRQPLAQYRYFMMLFAFMPFIYPFITINTEYRDWILKVLSIIMILWFYFQFDKIVWNYAPEIDIVIKSPIQLLFDNYYTT